MNIPKPESNHRYAWEEYENKIDEIKWLHFDKLMTVGQISEKLDIPDWIILDLFKVKKVDKLSYPELCRRRRELDFDKLYDLHFNQRFSLNDIHRLFGYSPLYTKRVFKDRGLSHLGFVNQTKQN